jgi:uncharacterized membrane protein YqhA
MQKKLFQVLIVVTGVTMLLNAFFTQNYGWNFWQFNMICTLVILSLYLSLKENEKQE